jgi:hypothetical protein
MKSAIKMAWEHGGADFQSRFDKSTAQAQKMKEGALPDTLTCRDFSRSLRLSMLSMHIHGKSCGGTTLARVFTMRLEGIVLLVLLVIGVWSLIALTLFSIWNENLVEQFPPGVIWLVVGIIGFSTVLLFLSTYI